jgi:hypothetical protein
MRFDMMLPFLLCALRRGRIPARAQTGDEGGSESRIAHGDFA